MLEDLKWNSADNEETPNLDETLKDVTGETIVESNIDQEAFDANLLGEDEFSPEAIENNFTMYDAEETPETDDESFLETEDNVSSALTISEGEYMSQLSFDEKVLEKIVSIAIHEMDGVLLSGGGGGFFNIKNSKGIGIQVNENDEVNLDLDVVLEYGKSAPEIFEQLNHLLSQRISSMTGLVLKNVNVHVTNVLTTQEFSEKN